MDDVGKLEDFYVHLGLDLSLEFRVFGPEGPAFRGDGSKPHILEDFGHQLLDALLVVNPANHANANLRVLRELRLLDANVPDEEKRKKQRENDLR